MPMSASLHQTPKNAKHRDQLLCLRHVIQTKSRVSLCGAGLQQQPRNTTKASMSAALLRQNSRSASCGTVGYHKGTPGVSAFKGQGLSLLHTPGAFQTKPSPEANTPTKCALLRTSVGCNSGTTREKPSKTDYRGNP